MLAFRSLVLTATDDRGAARQGLADDKAPVRILAAQTLQFLPCREMAAELIDAAEHDEEPAVRLYAVDALGTLGGKDARAALRRLRQTEKNRDVKRHVVYALERRPGSPVASVADSLRDWDVQRLDAARVGEMAPDFSLTSLSGETVALSSFRSRKSVALVFLYGDT
ncbi:MAG: HEAT repeat domain-containing protein [Planctomycetota bacterium]